MFDTESETQIAQYFWADTVTSQNHIQTKTHWDKISC